VPRWQPPPLQHQQLQGDSHSGPQLPGRRNLGEPEPYSFDQHHDTHGCTVQFPLQSEPLSSRLSSPAHTPPRRRQQQQQQQHQLAPRIPAAWADVRATVVGDNEDGAARIRVVHRPAGADFAPKDNISDLQPTPRPAGSVRLSDLAESLENRLSQGGHLSPGMMTHASLRSGQDLPLVLRYPDAEQRAVLDVDIYHGRPLNGGHGVFPIAIVQAELRVRMPQRTSTRSHLEVFLTGSKFEPPQRMQSAPAQPVVPGLELFGPELRNPRQQTGPRFPQAPRLPAACLDWSQARLTVDTPSEQLMVYALQATWADAGGAGGAGGAAGTVPPTAPTFAAFANLKSDLEFHGVRLRTDQCDWRRVSADLRLLGGDQYTVKVRRDCDHAELVMNQNYLRPRSATPRQRAPPSGGTTPIAQQAEWRRHANCGKRGLGPAPSEQRPPQPFPHYAPDAFGTHAGFGWILDATTDSTDD